MQGFLLTILVALVNLILGLGSNATMWLLLPLVYQTPLILIPRDPSTICAISDKGLALLLVEN